MKTERVVSEDDVTIEKHCKSQIHEQMQDNCPSLEPEDEFLQWLLK